VIISANPSDLNMSKLSCCLSRVLTIAPHQKKKKRVLATLFGGFIETPKRSLMYFAPTVPLIFLMT
jgi:hypothetical protein